MIRSFKLSITVLLMLLSISLPLKAGEKIMPKAQTQKIIENLYQYFNAAEMDKVLSLVSDDFTLEVNYGGLISGKEAYKKHLIDNKLKYYDEHVDSYILMISEDGRHATTKLFVKGRYNNTDSSLIPAKGQNYQLTAINYFELENGKIVKASCWFDDNDWVRQVS